MHAMCSSPVRPLKVRLALITTVIDDRPGRGTALVGRELLTRILARTDLFDITLIHHEENRDPIYTQHRTLTIPHLPRPFDRQIFREAFFWLKLRAQGERFDIIHYLHPRIWPSYVLSPGNIVVSMHEAGIMLDLHPHGLADRVFQFTYRFLHQRLDMVIAVSEFGKEEIAAYCKIPKERIVVIPNALSTTFAPSNRPDIGKYLLERFGIPSPYLLSVGRLDPHKNILRLIEAYALARREGVAAHLVLVGGRHLPAYSAEVEKLIADLNLSEHVHIAPFIPDTDLPDVYQHAEALLYPSLHEGFGMPLLEAMAAGTPIAAARAGSLPEIAAQSARFFDPLDIRSMKEAILEVTADKELRKELVTAGHDRIKGFSWDRSFARLRSLYDSLLPGRLPDTQ